MEPDERFTEESAESLQGVLVNASLTPHDRNEVRQQSDSARRCLDFRGHNVAALHRRDQITEGGLWSARGFSAAPRAGLKSRAG
jgi:hypothetical protein